MLRVSTQSIYEEVTTLNDIKFLLFYATRLFPPTVRGVVLCNVWGVSGACSTWKRRTLTVSMSWPLRHSRPS